MSATIYYHADCLDGFGSAYAAWRRFGDAARYRPLHHGDPWTADDVAGHNVYILDFSFPPEILEGMADMAASVTQIDHHTSAMQPWLSRLIRGVDGCWRYRHPNKALSIIFDLDKSGARLAWEFFHPETAVPMAIRHIEDLDLWRSLLPDSRAFCRSLRLRPFAFPVWQRAVAMADTPDSPEFREMLLEGRAIEHFFHSEIDRLTQSRQCRPAVLRGEPIDALQAARHGQAVVTEGNQSWIAVQGLAINANMLFASELGNRLAENGSGFGMIWQMAGDGEIKVSLRAINQQPDVSRIAARYGGGGHPNAAGFRMPATQFFRDVLKLDTTAD